MAILRLSRAPVVKEVAALSTELPGEQVPPHTVYSERKPNNQSLRYRHPRPLGAGGLSVRVHPLFFQRKPEQPKCRTARWRFSLPPSMRTCPISFPRATRQTRPHPHSASASGSAARCRRRSWRRSRRRRREISGRRSSARPATRGVAARIASAAAARSRRRS